MHLQFDCYKVFIRDQNLHNTFQLRFGWMMYKLDGIVTLLQLPILLALLPAKESCIECSTPDTPRSNVNVSHHVTGLYA